MSQLTQTGQCSRVDKPVKDWCLGGRKLSGDSGCIRTPWQVPKQSKGREAPGDEGCSNVCLPRVFREVFVKWWLAFFFLVCTRGLDVSIRGEEEAMMGYPRGTLRFRARCEMSAPRDQEGQQQQTEARRAGIGACKEQRGLKGTRA